MQSKEKAAHVTSLEEEPGNEALNKILRCCVRVDSKSSQPACFAACWRLLLSEKQKLHSGVSPVNAAVVKQARSGFVTLRKNECEAC